MKIPQTIECIGHDVIVKTQDNISLDDKEVCGLAIFDSDQIILAQMSHGVKLSEANIAEAFLHEIIHHISEAFQLSLNERQVVCLARGILAITRNNKLDYLDKE